MTMTDEDLLVRDLVTRADHALPPMALDPAEVLSGGRRLRRRRTARRWAGSTVGAGALVVAAAGLGGLGAEDGTPAATFETVTRGGVVITMVTAATSVETNLGTGLDLGLPVDPSVPEGPRYVVIERSGGTLELRTLDSDGRIAPEVGVTMAWDPAALRAGLVTSASGEAGRVTILGAQTSGVGPTITVDGEMVATVPTFEAPGPMRQIFFAVVDGGDLRVDDWPRITIGGLEMPFSSHADEERFEFTIGDKTGSETLEVAVATDVHEADSSAGPVLDLGLPVLDSTVRETVDGREELTYALVATDVGRVTGDASLTPEEAATAAVTIAGRKPFGALVPISAAPLPPAPEGGPVLAAGSSTTDGVSDGHVLGRLPDGATGATLIVQRKGGNERITLPTFAVPGLTGEHAFFFVTLHDEVEDIAAAWAHIEVAMADGTGTVWSLSGDLLYPQE